MSSINCGRAKEPDKEELLYKLLDMSLRGLQFGMNITESLFASIPHFDRIDFPYLALCIKPRTIDDIIG